MSLCRTHPNVGYCYACELEQLREKVTRLENLEISRASCCLENEEKFKKCRDAIQFFKDHEHDEKRGEALRRMWAVLLEVKDERS